VDSKTFPTRMMMRLHKGRRKRTRSHKAISEINPVERQKEGGKAERELEHARRRGD